jgi:hypothetical protein
MAYKVKAHSIRGGDVLAKTGETAIYGSRATYARAGSVLHTNSPNSRVFTTKTPGQGTGDPLGRPGVNTRYFLADRGVKIEGRHSDPQPKRLSPLISDRGTPSNRVTPMSNPNLQSKQFGG